MKTLLRKSLVPVAAALALAVVVAGLSAQRAPRPAARTPAPRNTRLEAFKAEVAREIDARAPLTARIIDQLYSYGELGFQEVESSRFLVRILRDSGFTVQEGFDSIPTAFVASWGSGRPVISLGSDFDGLPATSQWPGIVCHDPVIENAPGHGEGHNSGQAVNVTAAIVVKQLMQRYRIPGTIRVYPGIAEELLASRTYMVNSGLFRDVDVMLSSHVSSEFAI